MKKVPFILLITLLLTSCNNTLPNAGNEQTEPLETRYETEDAVTTNSYTFDTHNISFEYPFPLIISEMGESHIFIDTLDWTDFEAGGPPPLTSMFIVEGESIQDYIDDKQDLDQFHSEEVNFEQNTYTKITYYTEYIDGYQLRTNYLMDLEGALLFYHEGYIGEGYTNEGKIEEFTELNTTEIILGSLKVN